MRIVYIGTVDFSFHCLQVVLNNQGNVVGIATARQANSNGDYADLTPLANHYDIPTHYFRNINDSETVQLLEKTFS